MINIRMSKSDKLVGQISLFISFPYKQELVNLMRSRPERFWHTKEKEWELPKSDLEQIIPYLGNNYKIESDKSYVQELEKSQSVSLPTNYTFKTQPFKHQEEGVEYGLSHNRFLLADEQGLGKTKQVIDLACIKKKSNEYKHCLIIACVNSLKYNWFEEVLTHSNEKPYILGTRINSKGVTIIGSTKERLKDLQSVGSNSMMDNSYFWITNIETLRYKESNVVECRTKKNGVKRTRKITTFPVVEELQKLIRKGELQFIAADEIHRCKDSTSLSGKALLSLNTETMIAMTGTPLMNAPIDLYTSLKWLGYENHSLYSFKSHYCVSGGFGGHQIVGYKNLPELQTVLDKCMLRRLKEDVLDLPEKIYINEFVEMSQSQYKIYNSILENLRQNIDKIKLSPNPLTMLIRLRQVTGYPEIVSSQAKDSPKLDRMCELVEDLVADGKKCLIFSNWTNVLEPAYERLKKLGFKPALYTGKNTDVREEEKKRFRTDESCKVICGTIGAMGTGLTLIEGTTVIFLDEPWNRAIKDQCEDRVHRIGTTQNINVITIMCRDTIDEKINKIVYRKGKMSDIIVDKEEDLLKNPAVLNYLLS